MVTSLTNCAWSQTAVAEAAGGKVGAARVGRADTVFVETGTGNVGGRVGVLNATGWVN
jgi:hypothetical protein